MTVKDAVLTTPVTASPRAARSPARATRARVIIGGALLAVVVVVTIAAPQFAPYDPEAYDLLAMLQPPSTAHPFGTDELGRDVLSRVIWGGRPVLLVTVVATLLSLVIGVLLGFLAASGTVANVILSRVADIQLSIPGLVFALLAIALTGNHVANIIVVLALASWPLHFRVVRAHALSVRGLPFAEASRLAGSSPWYRATRNFLPGVVPLIAVTTSVTATVVALSATGLSYLGLGVVMADWGRMIATSKGHLSDALWASGFPALALVIFLFSIQLLADAIADRSAPEIERSRA